MLTRTVLPYVPDSLEARRHLAAMRADAELKANSLRHPAIRSRTPQGVVVVKAGAKQASAR
jgi:hypothetical protein